MYPMCQYAIYVQNIHIMLYVSYVQNMWKHICILIYTYLRFLSHFCFTCAYTQAHTHPLCLVYIQILIHMHIYKKHIHQYVILYILDVKNIWKIHMFIITHTCGFCSAHTHTPFLCLVYICINVYRYINIKTYM